MKTLYLDHKIFGIYPYLFVIVIFVGFSITSCKKFIETNLPANKIEKSAVFSNETTAKATIDAIYFQLANNSTGLTGLSVLCGLSADELDNYSIANKQQGEFYSNGLSYANTIISTNIWNEYYQYIYKANAIIEGLEGSNTANSALKNQLIGEAKFIRAFSHFYLTNLFGDIPLILTTDYRINTKIARTEQPVVYLQIITDLRDAKNLLVSDYSYSKGERIRPNKWAAVALLARVYLYSKDWIAAESEATIVINNTSDYTLLNDLNSVFLKNSREAIWQLSRDNGNPITFYLSGAPANIALRQTFVDAFESADQRRIKWTGTISSGSKAYYFAYKYKAVTANPITEYSMVLRLAEQFLIRAEARAKQGKLVGTNSATGDINVIRNRANLANTLAVSQMDLLLAIETERRTEFFTEWGHRWLDLKRTDRVNSIMQAVTPQKGGIWNTNWQLYPIPKIQMDNDPSMANAQNSGYD